MSEIENDENMPAVIDQDAGEDHRLIMGITLPSYDDVDDKKAAGYIKDVFKGFNFDPTEDFGKKFSNMKTLADYMDGTMDDIRKVRNQAETSEVLQKGACMARFWCLGKTLAKALEEGAYGTGACNKLATQMGCSVPYIYSIKAVGVKLTMTDCFLLGVRGCDTTHLRSLANMKDDDVRKSIIKAFIDTFVEYTDNASRDKAKKALVAAINMDRKTGYIETANSDPATGASTVVVSETYQTTLNEIHAWQKLLKKPADANSVNTLINALSEFFITEHTPDAQSHLDALKGEADQLKTKIQAVKNNLDDILIQLDSFAASEVLKDEEEGEEGEEDEDEGAGA